MLFSPRAAELSTGIRPFFFILQQWIHNWRRDKECYITTTAIKIFLIILGEIKSMTLCTCMYFLGQVAIVSLLCVLLHTYQHIPT